jgi:hypothetical protein
LGQLAAWGVRKDWHTLSFERFGLLAAMPLIAALLCLKAAVARGRFGLGLRRPLIWATGGAALLIPAVVAATLSIAPDVGPAVGARAHATCFVVASLWGGAPLVVLGLTLPQRFISQVRARSALLGAASGLGGAFLANWHCALVSAGHVGLAHHAQVALLSLFGAVILSRALRV